MTLKALEQLPGFAGITSRGEQVLEAYFIRQGQTVLADGTSRLHVDEWGREGDVAM